MMILSILYIYGNYSIYSPTFRLLGPNYQGKAVLAVLFFPMLFSMMIERLERPFHKRFGYLLCLLSEAACSLTLFGAVTMIVNVTTPTVLLLFSEKHHWKRLWYIVWAGAFPLINIGIFFLYKIAV